MFLVVAIVLGENEPKMIFNVWLNEDGDITEMTGMDWAIRNFGRQDDDIAVDVLVSF